MQSQRQETESPPFRAAEYRFTLLGIEIVSTRAWHTDSDRICVGISVDGGEALTTAFDLGTLGVGRYPLHLPAARVNVSDPDADVAIEYLIVNARYADPEMVDKVLTKTVGELVGAGGPPIAGPAHRSIPDRLDSEVSGLLAGPCDGLVAAERLAFKGIDLWRRTQGSAARFQRTTHHRGIPCAHGCGSTSDYWVTWQVLRT